MVKRLHKTEVASASNDMYDFSFLRELRKHEGLTIGDVSARSGISAAVISKLERNRSGVELGTLFKLGRAFDMSATDLIALAESRLAHKKQSRSYHSDGFRFKKIDYANVDCFLGEAEAGAKVSRPEIHHDDYEICWVLKGRIRLTLPHEQFVLKGGDSVQFDAIQAHTYEALEDTRLIIIHLRKGKRF